MLSLWNEIAMIFFILQWWSMFNVWSLTVEQTVLEINSTASRHTWWRHQMETCSALLALCVGNSPVTGEFPSQRPVTRGFDVFFYLGLNKRLSKHSQSRRFVTPPGSLWRHCSGQHLGTMISVSDIMHRLEYQLYFIQLSLECFPMSQIDN